MIKRIIFDIDNTLVTWKDEYDKSINKVFDKIGYPYTENLYNEINKAVEEYEKDMKYMDREELENFINKKLNLTLPINFIDLWIKELSYCVPEKYEEEEYNTLEYLNNKYELIALTNWFKENQVERLKKLGILKFFKEVYGAEEYVKPYKEAFIQAIGKRKINECVMVGDNLEIDIIGAKNAGIKNLIWKDNKNKKEEYKEKLENVKIIKSIEELKNIL